MKTMDPLVAGPPMLRALEELVAAAKLAPADAIKSDPDSVREAFWQGKCGHGHNLAFSRQSAFE